MSSDIESRLRQQLSIKALEIPQKTDKLDAVVARGRRRLLVSRAVMVAVGLVAVLGVGGLASVAFDAEPQPTVAVGQPDDASAADQPVTGSVGTATEGAAPTPDATNHGVEDETTAASSASFSGTCLPAPALGDVADTDPGKTVIRISTEPELQEAAQNLSANTVLLLAPGRYELTRTLYVQANDVTIRGDSNRCDEVELVGLGMENAEGKDSVPDGIWTDKQNLKVQNLTISDVYFHAITVNGGAEAPEIYNVRLLDSGEQFIKVNPIATGDGVDDGIVNYAVIAYTNGTPTTDHGGGVGYVQGVDIHAGDNWTVKNSRFENLATPDDADHLWGPAVLAWNGATNTTVEGNVFINVNRAVAFGLDESRPRDHAGGVIRNNMVVMDPGLYSEQRTAQSDGSILVWNSPGTRVLHNTVATQGNTLKSIELRFDSNGAEVRNNLVDAPINDRSDNDYVSADNVTVDDSSIFRNPALGDLHLTSAVKGVVGVAPTVEFALHDFDGDRRPDDAMADVGADEYVETPEPTTEPTEPGSPSRPATEPDEPTDTGPLPTGGLVGPSDLRYEGSFRVPDGGGDEKTTLAWGGAGLAYHEGNDSLFITGHDWHQLTAEISIPSLEQSGSPASLAQASFVQPLQDVTDGRLPDIADLREQEYGRIGGYLVDGDDLIVSGYDYYDADGSQIRSHLLTDVNMGGSSAMRSLSDDVPARWLGGAMATIPDAWQGAFGGDPYIGGLAGISIVGNSSVGPAAATFSRASLQGDDPAQLVLGYPLSAPLDGPETKSAVWNLTSESRGMVFPGGTSSVLHFGTHGIGDYCYGTGAACGDPERSAKGTHAYPYRYQVWAYDADDLAAVYRGQAAPESVRPYEIWELDLPYPASQTQLGGAAYDPSTGRIFISQAFADGDQPLIHVFTLG